MTDNKDIKKGATINEIEGNLLDAKDDVIVHQCNCTTNRSLGLSTAMFGRFPYADVYSQRKTPDEPGTIKVSGNNALRRVVALFGQRYPGAPKYATDLSKARLGWFRSCLEALADLKYKSYGFPHNIGCGLAGGKWSDYHDMIKKWAETLPADTVVNIYKLK